MSELNKKLSALSQQQQGHGPAALTPAEIRPIARSQPWRLAGSGVIALGIVGGLAWWQGSPADRAEAESTLVQVAASVAPVAPAMAAEPVVSVPVIAVHDEEDQDRTVVASPPTVTQAEPKAKEKPEVNVRVTSTVKVEAKPQIQAPTQTKVKAKSYPHPAPAVVKSVPVATPQEKAISTVRSAPKPLVEPVATTQVDDEADGLMIETVELNATQLATIEYQKAAKALKQGDSRKAISFLDAAIAYQPEWVEARQKLAALYYGRRESRQAMATLQQGLALDAEQPELRLTMAKLLLNESQQQAALNVLSQLPRDGSRDYLAMRGALAQQLNNNALALSSYQHLVESEPYDGRWWMGLGIALERSQAVNKARKAYQQALLMGQISNQSQQFIQQRLAVLESQEG